jgi:hypothetical protein
VARFNGLAVDRYAMRCFVLMPSDRSGMHVHAALCSPERYLIEYINSLFNSMQSKMRRIASYRCIVVRAWLERGEMLGAHCATAIEWEKHKVRRWPKFGFFISLFGG